MRPVRRARRSLLAAAGSLLILAGLLPVAAAPVVTAATPVFINEIHYDNTGTDTGEAIEVAGPAGTNLTGWDLVLYNGNGGAPYDTLPLSGTIGNLQNGYGTASVAAPGLQNGSPDGVALVDASDTVVQFLSYEGTFTAVGGPADALTSVDIGVSEAGTEAVGLSIGLTGTGTTYEDFGWTTGLDDSFGDVNPGQTFGTPGTADPVINEFVANHVGTDTHEYVEVRGDPSTDYSAYSVIQIEGDGTGAGVIDSVHAVGTTNATGHWVTGFLGNAFENGTISLLLVEGFTASVGNDLDTNNDGVLDVTPWTSIVDDVAVNDGGVGDRWYSSTPLAAGLGGSAFTPGGASRIPDGADTDATADWAPNDFDGEGLPQFTGTPAAGEAENTPGAPNELVTVPPPNVVINEIDYDQPGTDTAEFIELKNVGETTVDLSQLSVVLVNGTGGGAAIYGTITLTGTLAAGAYFVICANATTTANCDLDTVPDTNLIQNGAPDAVALLHGGAIIDTVSYEGDTGAPYTEGSGAGLDDTGVVAESIGRCPDGQDTDQNNVDVVLRPITPGAANDCPTGPAVSVGDVTLLEGDSGTTSFDFTVSLSEPAGPGGVTFDISTADGTATVTDNDYVANSLTGQTIPEGSSTYGFSVLVNGDTTIEPDETFFVSVSNVVGASVSDAQGLGTIVSDDVVITKIHAIQGSGDTAAAGTFTVEAIVVGSYQAQTSGQLRGFFLQEEDADVDANPATSEGIFVFCTTCPVPVSVGDQVRVTGSSSEFFGMSQLTAATAASVIVQSSGNALPTPAAVELPVPGVPSGDLGAATAAINQYFEPFEGMLVTYPDTLSVSEYFELARYGQLVLRQGGRPHTFTAVNEPSETGLINHNIDLARRTVILDDTDNRQNRPVDTPNTAYYHPVPGLSTTNFVRGGDTITNLTGVLHWSFAGQTGTDAWRIRPVVEAFDYEFTQVNEPPAAPAVEGRLKVASFNVLNYFLTIDTTSSNDVGTCGPSGTMDCRGADSAAELARQREKLLAALSAMDADVLGLMEMENTPSVEPLADIVADLPGYAYVDTGVIGTDAIRVGIIYKTSTVAPVGDHAVLDTQAFVNPRGADVDRNRPAVAQTFEESATGARFTVVVNHLKSKGSGCGPGDDDTTTGQGNCNLTRELAAEAMAEWLATDPTGSGDRDVLIIGDLNSYAKEDPIVALESAGYTNLVAAFGGSSAYSFVFDGQLGYLDHALANGTLAPQVADLAEWHINADEIPLFDYNDDVRDAGEATFEEESDVLPLYQPNEFRTSDHDPVIIGLDLLNFEFDGFKAPVLNPPATNTAKAGSVLPLRFSLSGDLGLDVLYETPQVFTCAGWPLGASDDAASADGLGLLYDAANDEYKFDWKTERGWANTCRTLEMTFDDGTYHTIDVNFFR